MVARGIALIALAALPATAFGQNVAEVQVAPPSVTLKIGERTGLLATAFDRAGNVIPTVRVIWSSNNVAVARVDNDGTVTGVAGGVAIIEARVAARKGQAVVSVAGAPGGGAAQPPPPQPPPAAGTGTPSGTNPDAFAGQPPGTGPAAVLRIEPPTVYLLPSENSRVSPRALKEDGSPAAPVAVTWKSLRPDIASVDQNGVIVALASGQGTVQVTSAAGLTATAPVVVQSSDIAIAEANPLFLSPGGVDTLRVIVPGQGNRVVSPLALQWSAADATVARVSLTGVVTAVAPGKTALAVTGLLQSKSLDIVVHKTVDQLTVAPTFKTEVVVAIQGSAKFQVQALAADKTPVPEAPIRWSVADTTCAGFDPASGVLTGKKAGKTTLTARGPGPGLVVTWQIRVISAGLKLSATRIGLPLGRRYGVKASFVDEAGVVLAPATGVTWVSDNPAAAAVSEDGTVSTAGYGHARITATAPGGKHTVVEVFVQGEILLASSRTGRFQLYSAERSNLAQWRKVVDDTSAATEPAVSSDGSRIAFTSTREGQPAIYVMDADGTGAGRLTNSSAANGAPAFTPDGQAVAYHSQRTGHRQLFVQPITGSDAIQLTQEPAENWHPTVSPDGETIAFVSNRDGNPDIWLMAKDGSNQRAFTKTPQLKESAPHFLRDGSLAYLVEQREGGRTVTQVVRAELVTGRLTPLTGTDLVITDFAVSPGGDLLGLVVMVQKNVYKVYIQPVGPGGGAPVPVPTTGAEQMVSPAFLP
ncbi:MAG TPA: Ig-like domain-containing protein [Gemmatimonadales bacterium]|jgi:TolB protein|nr:Ig-like domain-containing protein [Gemmatimonadales bacterium]